MTSRNTIPPNAKCVFKGEIFEVWQWEQKMYDGSTEIFERVRRPKTAQVITVVGDKILTQIEEQPDKQREFPSIPGGRCNEGEDPLDGAKRELAEETGLVSSDWILWKEIEPIIKIEWRVYTYIARNCTLKKKPSIDAGEKITARFVSLEEFLEIATENPLFSSPEIVADLLWVRFDPAKKEEFSKLLFGGNS